MLALGVGGTALLALGGAGLVWLRSGYRLGPEDVPIGLSAKELAVVRALVEALLPEVDGFPSGVALGVHQRIDEEVWSAPAGTRSDLRAAIQLLEHLPPWFGYPGRLSRMSLQDREACFQAYLRSEWTVLVQAASGLKQMCHLFYFVHEETWGPLGYDGPWVKQPVPPPTTERYEALLQAARA